MSWKMYFPTNPLLRGVVGHSWVGMLEKGDEHQPVVNKHIRKSPVNQQVETSKFLVPSVHYDQLGQDTNVRHHNVPILSRFKNRRGGVKVVILIPFLSFIFLSRNVGEQVSDPSTKLLKNELVQGINGRVTHNVIDVVVMISRLQEFFLGLWNEYGISFQVTRGLVVSLKT